MSAAPLTSLLACANTFPSFHISQVDPFGDLNTESERALGKIVAEKYNTGKDRGSHACV